MSTDQPLAAPPTYELVERCLHGDQVAWYQIVGQHWRKVVNLADKFDGLELSYQEIADQLGLPEGTVKSRINRGRFELAKQLRRPQEGRSKPAPTSEGRKPGGTE